jgi:flagellar hook-length control protein FliK
MNNQLFPFSEVASTKNNISSGTGQKSVSTEDKGFSDALRNEENTSKPQESQNEKYSDKGINSDKKQSVEADSAATDTKNHIANDQDKNSSELVDKGTGSPLESAAIESPEVGDDFSTVAIKSFFEGEPSSSSNQLPTAANELLEDIGEYQLLLPDSPELQQLVDTLISQLDDIVNEGGTEALEEAISPEALSALVEELQPTGKELPLIPAIDAIKNALSTQPFVTATDPGSPDLRKISALTALSEALATVKGGAQSTATDLPAIKVSTEAAMITENFSKALDSQLLQAMSDESLLLKPDSLSQRMAGDSALAPVSPQPPQTQALAGTLKPQLSVTIPFNQNQWGNAVAERVVWMNSQGIQEAEIHLDPPELGPMQVRVSVVNEQAQVSFVVQHSSVREALDQSAMRLRDMFEGEGINLTDVDVSDQSQQQANEQDSENRHGLAGSHSADALSEQPESSTAISVSSDGYSLVNTYA